MNQNKGNKRFEDAEVDRHYDLLSAEYEKKANKTLKARIHEEVQRLVFPEGIFLDAGCGTGWLVEAFAHIPRFHGLERNERMIARRRRLFPDRVKLGEVEAPPFGNEVFDAIFSINVAEHVSSPTRMWQACRRMLKLGGRLLVVTPAKEMEWALDTLERWNWKLPEGPHRFLRREELARSLRESGFSRVEARRILSFPLLGKPFVGFGRVIDRLLPFAGLFILAEAKK
jgi:SAM-dependent methyltransferase